MKKLLIWGITVISVILLNGCSHQHKDLKYAGTLDGTEIQIPAQTGGKIIRMMFEEGQLKQKGDTLAVIDTQELHFQLQQLDANLESLISAQRIAQTNLDQANRDNQYIVDKYERTKQLYQNKAASQQTLDDVSNQKLKTSSALHNSQNVLNQTTSNIEQVKAQILTINKKVSDAVILSPITGTISTKYYNEGEVIPPMGSIAEILDTRTLDVKIYISVDKLSTIKTGDILEVKAEGIDNTYHGKVIWISNQAEFTPKTVLTPETRSSLVYAVKVELDNSDGKLKQGMPVEVKLK
ncbi:MAG TPA: HlyD family efflux transporter periplasmic adaptor subunit [Candidatus Cloacimonadota bacterium]|nr:HlyD family efflux transporter periplasmic adaptor subunit [Candidatus Cloacimonadota bacterium]